MRTSKASDWPSGSVLSDGLACRRQVMRRSGRALSGSSGFFKPVSSSALSPAFPSQPPRPLLALAGTSTAEGVLPHPLSANTREPMQAPMGGGMGDRLSSRRNHDGH